MVALWIAGELKIILDMAGGGDMGDYCVDYVGSPLKNPVNIVVNPSDSVHTHAIDVGDGPLKGLYETARDKRVA